MLTHTQKVRAIQGQVRKFYKQKKKVRIYHGTATTTRQLNFKKGELIDISNLNQILEINGNKDYLVTEPNVSMEKLFNESVKAGFIPPVVMESPSITVGGGVQGGAGESGSFKWGAFHEICLEYEIVLGNGKIINASRTKNSDMFWAIACSYGTLGIITSVKLKVIPAKKFVRVTYHRTNNFSDAIDQIRKSICEPVDFVEGILYTKNEGVIIVGEYTEENKFPISKFTRIIDEYFYIHVRKIIERHKNYTELVPLKDYIFRHNRGVFWTGEDALKLLKIPFNKATRILFNPILNYKRASRFLQDINISQKYIVQDICIPDKNVLSFLKFSDKKTKIYPIFLCPAFISGHADKLSPGYLKTKLFIDVCLYAIINKDYSYVYKLNREIEREAKRMNGRKWFYGHVFYSKKDFWKMYDKTWYENMRKKFYSTDVFPDIYSKVYVSEKYKIWTPRSLLNLIRSPLKLHVD